MATFKIYTYFNVDQVATLLDGVTAIAGSGDYRDAFRLVAMLCFITFIAGWATAKSQEPMEFFRWLIIVVLIHAVLLVPKADVILVDRTSTAPPTVRSNVPIALAAFASITSQFGDTLTRTFESVFALPDDLKFQKTGLLFGNAVLVDTLQATPTSPSFRDDLVKFINNCTYFDLIAGRIKLDDLARTDDLWTRMADTSNTLSTPLSTAPAGSMICSDAYADLGSRWADETQLTLQTRGRALNPRAINNMAAGALLSTQIASSYTHLTGIANSATDMLRQNIALNAVRDSQMVAAQRLDSPSAAIVGAAQAQAEMTANTSYLVMARVAERATPALRNVIELICYAVFPLMILLLVVAGEHAGKYLKNYIMALVAVQLIPPLYAILNFAMTSTSREALIGVASSTTNAAAVNLVNIGQLSQRGLSEAAIAGYMTVLLPVIAWGLVKGTELGGAALFNAVMSPATSGAGRASDSVSTGNINQGNVSLDTTTSNNVNANHYDSAPTMTSGFSRVSTAAGTSINGSDGIYRFQSNQSTLGLSANFGQKLGNALSTEAASRQEVAKRESEAATQMRTAALVERMGIVKAYADHHGTNNLDDVTRGSRSAESVASLQQIAENVNQRLGLTANSSVGRSIVGTLSAGGGINFSKIAGAHLELSTNRVDTAEKQKQLEAAVSYAQEMLSSRNVTAENALAHDFRNSSAFQWGRQNRAESVKGDEAALTNAAQHSRNAEAASSDAFSLSHQARKVEEQWQHASMDYTGFLTKRMQEDGTLHAFNMLYQSNPEQAAKLAARYLKETTFDAMPTMPAITSDIKELQRSNPSLSGKTAASEMARLSPPADRATAAHSSNTQTVINRGHKQREIPNPVRDLTEFAYKQSKELTDGERERTTKATETERQQAAKTLERNGQIPGHSGPETKPDPGSVSEHQDDIHKKVFNDETKPER